MQTSFLQCVLSLYVVRLDAEASHKRLMRKTCSKHTGTRSNAQQSSVPGLTCIAANPQENLGSNLYFMWLLGA